MLKRAMIIVLGIFLFSLAANMNVATIKAEELRAENSAEIEKQIRQVFDEAERAMNNRVDLTKEYGVIVDELIGLYVMYKEKLDISQKEIDEWTDELGIIKASMGILETGRDIFVENKEELIKEFIRQHGATEESLGILKKMLESEKARDEMFKRICIYPAMIILEAIKEKIKSFDNSPKE